ncbi:MAG: vanadium-dependent haloperoxidase [Rhizobiaceae bacterium]
MSSIVNLIRAAMFACAWSFWLAQGAMAMDRPSAKDPAAALQSWYTLVVELVRHTATYSPPVASRAFAYLGTTAWEATASGNPDLKSLAGKLNGLAPLPPREAGKAYDETIVLNAALEASVKDFFWNTGPTGQRAFAAVAKRLGQEATDGKPADVVERSSAYGKAIAAHIFAWSQDDGGATIENMGFPYDYKLNTAPGHWVPTSPVRQQQLPLLPMWGDNRPFAMPDGASCALPAPPAYSEDKDSAFYKEALEVYNTSKSLDDGQKAIARFWSDDPMLTPTPPGHWIAIVLQIIERDQLPVDKSAEALARTGIAVADAFIGCWRDKFAYDLVRPVTYIRKVIDPKWEALLITPPFPEYPSGHSSESGAAAEALTALFGDNFAFEDATHVKEGHKPRPFPSFWAAAQEAGISRLYGGIHFRAAIDQGLEQGRCIGKLVAKLEMR